MGERASLRLSSGRSLAYSVYGALDGIPVLFIHGWPSASSQASVLASIARENGILLMAPDRPGVGGSEFHAARKLTDWPPLVHELMAGLKVDRFHVMGVSGGGLYALMLAHDIPERLLSVHVVSGAPNFSWLGGPRALPFHYAGLYGIRRWFSSALPIAFDVGAWLSHRVPHWPPLRWALKLYLCRRDYQALLGGTDYEAIARAFREAWTGDLQAMLTDGDIYLHDPGFKPSEIVRPVEFWHGKKDRHIPLRLAEQMIAQLPQAQVHIMEEEGHFSIFLLRAQDIFDQIKFPSIDEPASLSQPTS